MLSMLLRLLRRLRLICLTYCALTFSTHIAFTPIFTSRSSKYLSLSWHLDQIQYTWMSSWVQYFYDPLAAWSSWHQQQIWYTRLLYKADAILVVEEDKNNSFTQGNAALTHRATSSCDIEVFVDWHSPPDSEVWAEDPSNQIMGHSGRLIAQQTYLQCGYRYSRSHATLKSFVSNYNIDPSSQAWAIYL